jgi:glycosyltransferase involved in cell wall biosynthesis
MHRRWGNGSTRPRSGLVRMRIAMIAHTNAPWTAPYARHFASAGHDLKIISFHPDRLPGLDCEFVGHEPFRIHRAKHLFITRVPRVRRMLQAFAPDVVLACYVISNGLTAALAWDGPLVVSARGAGVLRQTADGRAGPPTRLRAWLLRYICGRATSVHAVSHEIVDRLRELGVPPKKIECFPLGVDLDRFRPAVPAPRGDDPIHIICTRRHEPVYQNHVIVEALARLREAGRVFRCTFVGGGTLLERCRAHIRERALTDCVRCVGPASPDRMPEWLASAQFFVSASSSDGTSSSLLEAMSAGLFPIVTDIRANRDWLRDGETGLFFDVGRPDQLARALTWGLTNPAIAAHAARLNRRVVAERGDRQACNARMEQMVTQAAGARGSPITRARSLRVAGLASAFAASSASFPEFPGL